jgi:4-hydroxy-3-methylbut-2-enyl diphosphate reductase
VPDDASVSFVTQTTLSVDDTADIVATLRKRFPKIDEPRKEDICYATTNRQAAVKSIADRCDLTLIVGAANSSNSNRLVEVAVKAGCPTARLIRSADDINWSWFDQVSTLGLSAGASAPEELVQGVITACGEKYKVTVEEIDHVKEDVIFHLPKAVRDERTFDRDQMKASS